MNRRNFFTSLGSFAIASAAFSKAANKIHEARSYIESKIEAGGTGFNSIPVNTPDLPKLPYRMENGYKVFNLIAEPIRTEFIPGRAVDAWGYNGSVPGPTIEVQEGDKVKIEFENRLPEPTTVHWHGLEVPIAMDGVPGVTQPRVMPGEKFTYKFQLHQNGTYFYHSHMAMQEMLGMVGFFIIHPRKPYYPKVDKDFGILLQEWAILPNNTIPNTFSMEFNWLTLNGKSGPATTPLIVKLGDRVRIRFVNLGMDHHPMHVHGIQFYMTGTEAGRVPQSMWFPQNTVLVGVAQARDIEFDAVYPGDWLLHCHLPHHMMNHMASMVGPMAHIGSGMHTGMGMEEGMGAIKQGSALDENLGPGFGRGMGLAAMEKETSNLVGNDTTKTMMNMGNMNMMNNNKMGMNGNKLIPGYPQDMWMPMDEMVEKPETYGLRKDWSGGIMGMMTIVRVLEPKMYDIVVAKINADKNMNNKKMKMKHHNMNQMNGIDHKKMNMDNMNMNHMNMKKADKDSSNYK